MRKDFKTIQHSQQAHHRQLLHQQQLLPQQQRQHRGLAKANSLPLDHHHHHHPPPVQARGRLHQNSSPQQLTNAHNVSQDSGLSPSPLDHPVNSQHRVTPPQQYSQQHHASADEAFSCSNGFTTNSHTSSLRVCCSDGVLWGTLLLETTLCFFKAHVFRT